jgi:hypothetical protein
MQHHDARRAEASPWTRLLSDDRLTWTITEAPNFSASLAPLLTKPPTGASCRSASSAGECSFLE